MTNIELALIITLVWDVVIVTWVIIQIRVDHKELRKFWNESTSEGSDWHNQIKP